MRISDWSSDVCSSDLPCDGLPIHDRGLAYGDGLFETIRVAGGQARLVERHLQRLQDGCERLAIPVDANLLRNELMRFCRALGQRSEEHTSELQSLMRISYAVFCLKQKKMHQQHETL